MHGAGAGDAGLAAKRIGDHQDMVMRLALGPRPGMAGMAGAVIGDGEGLGREGGAEDGIDTSGAGLHGTHIGFVDAIAKRWLPSAASVAH